MVKLVNRAKMTTSTTGTGTITLGSAVDGFQTFAAAGVSNGETVRYCIEDGTSNFELGSGVFTASGTTLTRVVSESSNSNNAINLSGDAIVFITAIAADLQPTTFTTTVFTATANQTAFSVSYTVGFVEVFLNGSKLSGADFTATNGTSIVLASGATVGDTVDVVAFATQTVANVYTQTQSDARYLQLTGGTLSGDLSGTTSTFSGDVTIADKIVHSGDTNTAIRFPAVDTFSVETDGSERLRVDSTGKLGIGTNSPIEKLQVVGQLISTGSNSTASTSGAERAILDLTSNAARVGHFRGSTSSGSGKVEFFVDSVKRVTIDPDGKVGIGTGSPSMILDVDGSSSGNDVARFSGPNSGGLTFRNATSNEFILHTATSDALTFGTNGNNERMRIDSGGLVGIGNTSPSSQLSGAADLVIGDTSDADSGMTFVTSTSGQGLIHFSDATSGNARYDGFIGYEQTGRFLKFGTAQTERFRFGSSGELGIGGATYGTSGQVLTSGGSGAAPTWGDAAGGGSAEFTAGEAITAGDPVSLNSSGQLVKVSGAVQGTTLPDSSNTLEVKSGGSFETASGADLLLIPNTSKAIWIYNYNSTVKAQILSVSGTTISKVGSEISVSSRNGKHIYATWGPSSGDKFAIVYRDSSAGDDGFVALCSYNSGTDAVTIESETNISTEFSSNRSEGTCVVFDESASAFLFAFKDAIVSNRGYVGVATLSGTTWTFGAKVTFNNAGVGDEIGLVYDASLSLSMLVYLDNSIFYAHRVTVSGTTPTVATAVTNNDISWNEDVASSRRLAGDGAGRFIACYDSSSNTRYILIKATSGSTTIADQTELTWYDDTNSKKADFVSVAFVPFATPSSGSITGRWVSLGYHQSNTTSSFGFAEEAGTNNITRGGLSQILNGSSNYLHGNLGLLYVPAQATIVGVGAANGSTSYAFGAKLAADSTTATKFVGLAEAGIASGASGKVTVTGGINTAQTGLTAGIFYYLTGGGGLSTSSTSFPLGIAKSSSNLVVGGNAADFNAVAPLMTKISTTTVSSSVSNVNITLPTSGYTSLRLSFSNVKNVTDNVDAQIRLSSDGGSNFKSLYYARRNINSSVLDQQSSGKTLTINSSGLSNSANTFLFGFIDIYIPTERSTAIQWNIGYSQQSSNQTEGSFGLATMVADDSQVIANYIRFQFGSGNLDKGVFTLYGIE